MYMGHYKWECFPRQRSRDKEEGREGGRDGLYEQRVDRVADMKEHGA